MKNKISVLMPVYNCDEYIRDSVESILIQTYKDFNFIIINDGSTDRTRDMILSYSDDRIKLIDTPNSGLSNALNTGINIIEADYIVRQDGDDISDKYRLEKLINYMDLNINIAMCGSWANVIDDKNKLLYRYKPNSRNINKLIFLGNSIIHSSVICRTSVLKKIGGYRISGELHSNRFFPEDYELWSRMIISGYKIDIIRENLVSYRLNSNGLCSKQPKSFLDEQIFISKKIYYHHFGNIKNELAYKNIYCVLNGYINSIHNGLMIADVFIIIKKTNLGLIINYYLTLKYVIYFFGKKYFLSQLKTIKNFLSIL